VVSGGFLDGDGFALPADGIAVVDADNSVTAGAHPEVLSAPIHMSQQDFSIKAVYLGLRLVRKPIDPLRASRRRIEVEQRRVRHRVQRRH